MEKTKGNPIRWVTPEFPTLGKYEYDDEIAWIDTLESSLPEKVSVVRGFDEFERSNDEVARIRAEIQAATQHCHAAYFQNLEALLHNIGILRRERGAMWCSFGVFGRDDPAQRAQMPHYPKHLLERREGMLSGLYEWLRETPMSEAKQNAKICDERVEWIYSALGEPVDAKRWLVGHLCRLLKDSILRPWLSGPEVDLCRYSLHDILHRAREPLEDDAAALDVIEKNTDLTDDVRMIRKLMARPEDQMCHFRFERWIDNLIVAIGQLKSNSDHAPAEPGISVEAWMDRIREYVRAINAWIDGVPSKEIINQVDASAKVSHWVYDLLGETSPAKLWLAASLSKTMRSIGDPPFIPLDEAPPQRFKANVV